MNALTLLKDYCGFKKGENIIIIEQKPSSDCKEYIKEKFERQFEINKNIEQTCRENNIPYKKISYEMQTYRNGVEPNLKIDDISADLILMTTAFSLTHTTFAKELKKKGIRYMTAPGFSVADFETLSNKEKITQLTEEYFQKLSNAKQVKVMGKDTDILVDINSDLLHKSAGEIDETLSGQVPGAEVYCVPKNANGKITVPIGFGGSFPLEHEVTFIIKDCTFSEFIGQTPEAQKYINEKVRPIFEGKNFEILAELGIGTNPNITPEYFKTHPWGILQGEKMYGSAHFANGNSKGMGGDNDVPIHIDWVVPDVQIEFIN